MSVNSDNMPAAVTARSTPQVLRHLAYFIAAAIAVFAAATMNFDGYVLNILMQATTFSIAVFGLSVVLGLCGQINLAQAAFFGLGAYVVGLGTADYQINFWICLVGGAVLALGAVLLSLLVLNGANGNDLGVLAVPLVALFFRPAAVLAPLLLAASALLGGCAIVDHEQRRWLFMPGARSLWVVTMKLRPVRIDEKPRINTPMVIQSAELSARTEYGV